MNSDLCKKLDIEFPLFAFSHCRDVVAAVTNAGGMGVLGCVGMTPDELEADLCWIDSKVNGGSYGVDLIVPNKFESKGEEINNEQLLSMVPESHSNFAKDLMKSYDVPIDTYDLEMLDHLGFRENISLEGAKRSLEVAFSHPIKLIANALGVPPKLMIEMGKETGVAVAALVGTKEHALKQVEANVDILIASGGEAGGHCGDVATMVLVPEVVRAVRKISSIPILAAGGIVTGEQMAAAMAMGAAGAWCGSVWLTSPEAETNQVVKEKMLKASSRDTVRAKSRTGKPSRQLKSPWTEAWENNKTIDPLPMPLQSLVSEPALLKFDKLANSGHQGAADLATYWVGQGVGLMNQPISSRAIVQEFKVDFSEAYERLLNLMEG